MAEDHWLQDLSCQKFQDDEQDRGQQKHFPAGPHRGGENERKYRRDERSDIGHKPHDHRDEAPQRSRGHADELQADADRHAEPGVEGDLR